MSKSYVIITVSSDLGDELNQKKDLSENGKTILETITTHNAELLIQNTSDESLPMETQIFLTISAPSWEKAVNIADELRDLDGVEAAYPKPMEELP